MSKRDLRKRIFAVLVAIMMTVGMIPGGLVFAYENGEDYPGIEYEVYPEYGYDYDYVYDDYDENYEEEAGCPYCICPVAPPEEDDCDDCEYDEYYDEYDYDYGYEEGCCPPDGEEYPEDECEYAYDDDYGYDDDYDCDESGYDGDERHPNCICPPPVVEEDDEEYAVCEDEYPYCECEYLEEYPEKEYEVVAPLIGGGFFMPFVGIAPTSANTDGLDNILRGTLGLPYNTQDSGGTVTATSDGITVTNITGGHNGLDLTPNAGGDHIWDAVRGAGNLAWVANMRFVVLGTVTEIAGGGTVRMAIDNAGPPHGTLVATPAASPLSQGDNFELDFIITAGNLASVIGGGNLRIRGNGDDLLDGSFIITAIYAGWYTPTIADPADLVGRLPGSAGNLNAVRTAAELADDDIMFDMQELSNILAHFTTFAGNNNRATVFEYSVSSSQDIVFATNFTGGGANDTSQGTGWTPLVILPPGSGLQELDILHVSVRFGTGTATPYGGWSADNSGIRIGLGGPAAVTGGNLGFGNPLAPGSRTFEIILTEAMIVGGLTIAWNIDGSSPWGQAMTSGNNQFAISVDDMVVVRPGTPPAQEIDFNLATDSAFQAPGLVGEVTGHEQAIGSARLNVEGGETIVTVGRYSNRNFMHVGNREANSNGINIFPSGSEPFAAGTEVRITGRTGANWPPADRAMEVQANGSGDESARVNQSHINGQGATFTLVGTVPAGGANFIRVVGNTWNGAHADSPFSPAIMDFYIYSIIIGTNLALPAADPAETLDIATTELFWPPATLVECGRPDCACLANCGCDTTCATAPTGCECNLLTAVVAVPILNAAAVAVEGAIDALLTDDELPVGQGGAQVEAAVTAALGIFNATSDAPVLASFSTWDVTDLVLTGIVTLSIDEDFLRTGETVPPRGIDVELDMADPDAATPAQLLASAQTSVNTFVNTTFTLDWATVTEDSIMTAVNNHLGANPVWTDITAVVAPLTVFDIVRLVHGTEANPAGTNGAITGFIQLNHATYTPVPPVTVTVDITATAQEWFPPLGGLENLPAPRNLINRALIDGDILYDGVIPAGAITTANSVAVTTGDFLVAVHTPVGNDVRPISISFGSLDVEPGDTIVISGRAGANDPNNLDGGIDIGGIGAPTPRERPWGWGWGHLVSGGGQQFGNFSVSILLTPEIISNGIDFHLNTWGGAGDPNRWAYAEFALSIDDVVVFRPADEVIMFNMRTNAGIIGGDLPGGFSISGPDPVAPLTPATIDVISGTYSSATHNMLFVSGRSSNQHGINLNAQGLIGEDYFPIGTQIRVTGRAAATWPTEGAGGRQMELGGGVNSGTLEPEQHFVAMVRNITAAGVGNVQIAANAWSHVAPATEASIAALMSFYVHSIIIGTNLDVLDPQGVVQTTEGFRPPAVTGLTVEEAEDLLADAVEGVRDLLNDDGLLPHGTLLSDVVASVEALLTDFPPVQIGVNNLSMETVSANLNRITGTITLTILGSHIQGGIAQTSAPISASLDVYVSTDPNVILAAARARVVTLLLGIEYAPGVNEAYILNAVNEYLDEYVTDDIVATAAAAFVVTPPVDGTEDAPDGVAGSIIGNIVLTLDDTHSTGTASMPANIPVNITIPAVPYMDAIFSLSTHVWIQAAAIGDAFNNDLLAPDRAGLEFAGATATVIAVPGRPWQGLSVTPGGTDAWRGLDVQFVGPLDVINVASNDEFRIVVTGSAAPGTLIDIHGNDAGGTGGHFEQVTVGAGGTFEISFDFVPHDMITARPIGALRVRALPGGTAFNLYNIVVSILEERGMAQCPGGCGCHGACGLANCTCEPPVWEAQGVDNWRRAFASPYWSQFFGARGGTPEIAHGMLSATEDYILATRPATGEHDHNHGMTFNLALLRTLVDTPDPTIVIEGVLLGAGSGNMTLETAGTNATGAVGTGGAFSVSIASTIPNSIAGWQGDASFDGFRGPFLASPNMGAGGGSHGNYRITGIYIDGVCVLTVFPRLDIPEFDNDFMEDFLPPGVYEVYDLDPENEEADREAIADAIQAFFVAYIAPSVAIVPDTTIGEVLDELDDLVNSVIDQVQAFFEALFGNPLSEADDDLRVIVTEVEGYTEIVLPGPGRPGSITTRVRIEFVLNPLFTLYRDVVVPLAPFAAPPPFAGVGVDTGLPTVALPGRRAALPATNLMRLSESLTAGLSLDAIAGVYSFNNANVAVRTLRSGARRIEVTNRDSQNEGVLIGPYLGNGMYMQVGDMIRIEGRVGSRVPTTPADWRMIINADAHGWNEVTFVGTGTNPLRRNSRFVLEVILTEEMMGDNFNGIVVMSNMMGATFIPDFFITDIIVSRPYFSVPYTRFNLTNALANVRPGTVLRQGTVPFLRPYTTWDGIQRSDARIVAHGGSNSIYVQHRPHESAWHTLQFLLTHQTNMGPGDVIRITGRPGVLPEEGTVTVQANIDIGGWSPQGNSVNLRTDLCEDGTFTIELTITPQGVAQMRVMRHAHQHPGIAFQLSRGGAAAGQAASFYIDNIEIIGRRLAPEPAPVPVEAAPVVADAPAVEPEAIEPEAVEPEEIPEDEDDSDPVPYGGL